MKKYKVLCVIMIFVALFSLFAAHALTIEIGGEVYDLDSMDEIRIETTPLDSVWLFDQLEDVADREQLTRDMLVALYLVSVFQQSPYADESIAFDSFISAVEYISGEANKPRRIAADVWQLDLSEESYFEIHVDEDNIVRVVFVLQNIESAFDGQLRVDIGP